MKSFQLGLNYGPFSILWSQEPIPSFSLPVNLLHVTERGQVIHVIYQGSLDYFYELTRIFSYYYKVNICVALMNEPRYDNQLQEVWVKKCPTDLTWRNPNSVNFYWKRVDIKTCLYTNRKSYVYLIMNNDHRQQNVCELIN